jgi:hypothetical protein
MWTEESALNELDKLINECSHLEHSYRNSAEHIQWLARTYRFLEQVFGYSSMYYKSFASLSWQASGNFIVQSWDIQSAIDERHHKGYLQDLEAATGILKASRDELERTGLNQVYEGKNSPIESSDLIKLLNLAERKLRKVIRVAPKKERDVQDAFESLLIGADISYSREGASIEYSSKKYIPDFSVKKIDLAIEIKLCNRASREKELIAEINDDILAYKQKYGNILFVVYDLSNIRDIDRFTEQFEENDGVLIRVIKH